MEKDTARVIVETMLDIIGRLNNSIFLVMEAADEDEVQRYKHAVAQAMGGIIIDLTNPIFEQYPDLMPMELRGSSKPAGYCDSSE